jgi:hypothetical protein
MTDDAKLLGRAKSILKELRLRRPTFLQSWMAQYVAECIDGLEAAEPAHREAVVDRCAATITHLWTIQLQLQTNTLERGVNHMLRRTDLDDHALRNLYSVLSENGTTSSTGPEAKVTIWQLGDLEHLVIELFFVASERRKRTHPKLEDTDALSEVRDRDSTEVQKKVAAVFPALGGTSLDDFDAVQGSVDDALRAIDRERRRLIRGNGASAKSAPRTRRQKR